MMYIFYYIILGVIIGILTWFWNSKKNKDYINEGGILIYLFGYIFLWPAILVSTVIDIIQFIVKEYCNR